jgi:glyoxylase-like metal-dependent hydrolase (beta-lactamase superfamily II)
MKVSLAGDGAALHVAVFVGATHTFENGSGTFSPTTSTLITGAKDAVLVDAQHIKSDVKALGDMIAQSGKRLTAIYVTHGHADHWYGTGELLRRFPTARAVATAGVIDYIETSKQNAAQQWRMMFGDRVVDAGMVPQVLNEPLELEGHELRVIEVGQGDITPSTVLFVPAIATAVPGDVVYNGIHVMLGLSGPRQWDAWLASIDKIERLAPKAIVAGHKRAERPDTDVDRIINETRSYIRTFAEAAPKASTPEALVDAVSARFPDFGNLWTLQFSARSYFANHKA